jgi:hypothetical protein
MKSTLVALAMVLVVILLIWGSLHLFIRPINPQQKTPEGHFSGSCWACHFVRDSAKVVEE